MNNWIADKETLIFAQVLQTNKTLTMLNLANNLITDAGIKALALVLQTNTTLKLLDLTYNSFEDTELLKPHKNRIKTNFEDW